jgi:taurine transport system permease protein
MADVRSSALPAGVVDATPSRRRRRRFVANVRTRSSGGVSTAGLAVISFLLLIGVWWFAASVILRDPVLLPTPGAVAERFFDLAFPGPGQESLWPNTFASLRRVLVGWGAGVAAGVVLGAVMASNRVIRDLIEPILDSGRAIPPLAFAPLMVVWFGIGESSKYVLLFVTAFPVIAVTTVAALAGVPESYLRAARSLGARRTYLLRRVLVPAILPSIFTAARVALALTWGTVVAAEIVAANEGLGWMILQASNYLNTPTIFVGIVVIGILAYLLDRVLRLLERTLVPWKGKA